MYWSDIFELHKFFKKYPLASYSFGTATMTMKI